MLTDTNYSMNEIYSLTRHAAQGAQHPLADEVAQACVWLSRYGFTMTDRLVNLLTQCINQRFNWNASPKHLLDHTNTPTCAVLAGCYLQDSHCFNQTFPLALSNIQEGYFLLPSLFFLSQKLQKGLSIRFTYETFICYAEQVYSRSHPADMQLEHHALIIDSIAEAVVETVSPTPLLPNNKLCLTEFTPIMPCNRIVLHPDQVHSLQTLAQRIYAPATEASRLRGAG